MRVKKPIKRGRSTASNVPDFLSRRHCETAIGWGAKKKKKNQGCRTKARGYEDSGGFGAGFVMWIERAGNNSGPNRVLPRTGVVGGMAEKRKNTSKEVLREFDTGRRGTLI